MVGEYNLYATIWQTNSYGTSWQYNPYAIPLFIGAFICASLAVYILGRRRLYGAPAFTALLLLITVWTLADGIEYISANPQAILFWDAISYIGLTLVPVAILTFVLYHTERGSWLQTRLTSMLFLIPIITLFLRWTDMDFHLIYSQYEFVTLNGSLFLQYTWTNWFYLDALYSYVLVLLAMALLVKHFKRSEGVARHQALILILSVSVPFTAAAVEVLSGASYFDWTAMSLTFTGFGFFWAVFRYRLFDLMPVARESLIRDMSDGVIVLDSRDHIVDVNPVGERLLGAAATIIGRSVRETLERRGVRRQYWTNGVSEINLVKDGAQHYFDLTFSDLKDRRGSRVGRIGVLRDITERKQMEGKLGLLHEHALRLSSAKSMEEIVKHTLDAMEFGLGLDYVDVRIVEDGWLRCKGARGREMINAHLPLDGPGVTVRAANTRRAIMVADTRKEPCYVDRMGTDWKGPPTMLSELAVPVIVNHETTAVLNVESAKPDAITKDDQTLVETLASHVASAMNRLRHEDELRRYSENLEILVKKRSGELAESEKRFRELVEILPETVFETDLEGKFVFLNKTGLAQGGFSEEDLRNGLNIIETISSEDRDRAKLNVQRQLNGEGPCVEEYTALREDGSTYPLSIHSAPLVREGKRVGLTGIGVDMTERKRSEEALRQREAFLEAIIENIPNMMFLKESNELRYVRVNRTEENLVGYHREDLIGKTDYDLFPAQQADYFVKKDREVLEGRRLIDIPEEPILTREKGQRILHTKKIPILDESGRPEYLLGISDDITDRKRAEEALRVSEARYRRLFESSPISLWEEDFSEVKRYFDELRGRGIKDFRGYFTEHPEDVFKCASMVKIVDVNEATLGLYGAKSTEELVGELGKVLSRESQAEFRFREELVALGEGKTRFASEFDNQTLRGDMKYVSLILNVAPGYEDTLAKVLVSIIDLTPQKKLEEELQSAYEQLDYVLSINPAVVFLEKPRLDLSDKEPIFVSKSAVAVLGFEPENFIGKSGAEFWESRLDPHDLTHYRAQSSSLWSNGHRSADFRFLHKDGAYRWIHEDERVIRDAEGRIVNVVGVEVDITEQKKIEEQLAKSQRLATIGETAAMVGHDLRNPLQGIASATYLLRDGSLTKEERDEMLQLIDDNVKYSDKIVNDLLDYSRTFQLTATVVTPKKIVTNALLAAGVPDKIKVLDKSRNQPIMIVDPNGMRRVLVNLIKNAIDAMPEGGTLTIDTEKIGGNVEIVLADTGSGMSDEVMGNLWKPLQTTKAKGMGFGLAICKRIMEAHKGTISVKSKVGEGTTVTLRLPIKPELEEEVRN